MASYFTRVHFRVVAHTHHGEVLHLVGDSPNLGCWEPLQGVALETDSDSYPVWRTREPVSLPSEQRVEFKLTLVDTDEFNLTPFVKGWEGIDGNRTLLPRGEELTVELVMHEQPGLAAASGSRRFLASSRSGGDVSGGGASAHSVGSAIDMGLMPPAAAPVAAVAGALPPLATSASAALLVNNSANNGDGGGGGNGGNGGGDFESAPVLRASVSHADGLSGSLLDPACQEAVLSASDAVMVVCYVLPVTITRLDVGAGGLAAVGPRWAIEWNQDSIVAKKHRSLTDQMRVVWVGCPHVCLTQELSPVERETLADALRAFHCVPVFVSEALHHASYAGFCRKHLWPTFHNHVSAYSRPEAAFSLAGWRAYTAVNKAFSDIVTEAYEPGDLIWVHDYHLLLLPSFILRKLRTASVGLFLHTPFPASEVFRTLPVRDELLRGMLNADLIGFHLFEYARSFLTCCKRMLGLEHEFAPGGFLAVRDGKRTVYVQASHVGIEPETLAPHLRTVDCAGIPPGLEGCAELVEALSSGRALIGGIDECERLRGVALKLLAFEQLLEANPEWRGKVSLVQLVVDARNYLPTVVADADPTRAELRAISARTNALSPRSVILVEIPTAPVAQRMALWAAMQVAVFSAVHEGVNVFPLEYVYARSGEHAGVVVLSETCSCAHVLNGALRVNVWSSDELVNAMLRALTMAPAERIARQQRDLIFVVSNTTQSWAERFFVDLKAVGQALHKADETQMAVGFGLASFRCVGMGGMRTLEVTDVLAAYRKTVRRAIFVDWGGTLVPNDDRPLLPSIATEDYALRALPPATRHCLESLSQDPRNFVMVVSGLARGQMEAVFGSLPAVSLAAEHGLLYRVGSTPGSHYRGAGHWEQIVESFDDEWKDLAAAIVETYAIRTNGSYVQRKGSSVVWRFEDADLEFGSSQAKEMREHLDNLLQGYPVDVVVGKGYVEIKPAGVDKGVIVQQMLNHLAKASGGVDFVLCLGDDSSDEKMFAALNQRFGLGGHAGAVPASPLPRAQALAHHAAASHVFCATVGRKPSAAQYYVNDNDEVLELLQSLRLHSTRSNRNRSLTDLNRLGHHGGGAHAHPQRGGGGGGGGPHSTDRAGRAGGADADSGGGFADRADAGEPRGAAGGFVRARGQTAPFDTPVSAAAGRGPHGYPLGTSRTLGLLPIAMRSASALARAEDTAMPPIPSKLEDAAARDL